MGMLTDVNIIGTVMRNQRRKLYPDLFMAFRRLLDLCEERGETELAKKTYLYCHTSYPDVGWDLPSLLLEHGIGHKVIFTYLCRHCKKHFSAFFQDARTICPHCRSVAGVLPSVAESLSREQLASIYQLFDVYVQYAICEGQGFPAMEAAACGVPVMEVDYSAMSTVVRKLGGVPLKVKRMFRELETFAYRALPDNDDCAEQLHHYFTKPADVRKRHRAKTYANSLQYFTWDNNARMWGDYIDSVQLTDMQGQWDAPPNIRPIPKEIPPNLTNVQFVEWLLVDVLGEPRRINSRTAVRLIKELNHGVLQTAPGQPIKPITREQVFKSHMQRLEDRNLHEQARCGMLPLTNEDYIQYANLKEQIYR
jgi:hypothetical protein